MNILIAAEKPSISRWLAPFVRRHWPDANITFIHVAPYGNIKFSYPRGLKMQNFPFLSDPVNRIADWAEWLCLPSNLTHDGRLSPSVMGFEHFLAADLIVYACDPDHTGAVSFEVLLEQVFGDDRAKDCPAIWLQSLNDDAIERAIGDMRPLGELGASSLSYGRMKRYFDWNWNVNSLAILGETQRRAGVPADAPPLSKYALQLLYGLRDQPPMSEGRVATLMHRWPGTGRYAAAKWDYQISLGSPASIVAIMENLLKAGLLERSDVAGKSYLAVTACGRTLLSLLHPDCEDADLPFRLHAWCEQGMAAKPAVNRYLNTFFGKQKRFHS